MLERPAIEPPPVARALQPHPEAARRCHDRQHHEKEIRPGKRRKRHDHPGRERQFLPELVVEGPELRDHPQHDDPDHDAGQQQQDCRIDQGGNRFPLHPRHHFDVGHVPADDLFEASALLPGQERRRVNTGKQRPVRIERLGERVAPPHPLVDIVQHALEERVRHPLPENVEGLHQRHAGLEQGRQLLVEDEELPGRNARAPRHLQGAERHVAGALDGQHVQPFFLEFVPQPRFALRGVDAFDDLPPGGAEPAAELHAVIADPSSFRRKILSVWTLSAVPSGNYTTPRQALTAGDTNLDRKRRLPAGEFEGESARAAGAGKRSAPRAKPRPRHGAGPKGPGAAT